MKIDSILCDGVRQIFPFLHSASEVAWAHLHRWLGISEFLLGTLLEL